MGTTPKIVIRRPKRIAKNTPLQVNHETVEERIKIHSESVEYSKQAAQYLFYANGTALTTLLINFDVGRYHIPIYIFGLGVVFSIMIPILFCSRCNDSIVESISSGLCPLEFWHKQFLFKIFGPLSMWFPAILFFYGLPATADCFNGIPPRSPLALMQEVLNTLKDIL